MATNYINLIVSLCEQIKRGYDAELSGMDDWMITRLIELGDFADEIIQVCRERDALRAELAEIHKTTARVTTYDLLQKVEVTVPRIFGSDEILHPLAIGTKITSIKGEVDDDGDVEQRTGPMAVGVIKRASYYPSCGWSYNVWFDNGTSVFIDEKEINNPDEYIVHN